MKKKTTKKRIENEKEDWRLDDDKDDISTIFAKDLAKNPKNLKDYKRYVAREFNKTKELPVFLLNLRVIAIAEGITALAKKTNMKRPNVYRFLSKDNNPSFKKLSEVAGDLGLNVIIKAA